MLRILTFILCTTSILLATHVDQNSSYVDLLSQSDIYIDRTKQETLQSIKTKKFTKNNKHVKGFGYAPDFHVWIRFSLTNTSSKPMKIILEYGNPLTASVNFYDETMLLKKAGWAHSFEEKLSINPVLELTLLPHETKTYYIEAHTHITTLIAKTHLYTPKLFYKKEMRHQFILALFFGGMGIIVLYNFIIYLVIRRRSYLYYVLSFMGIICYYLLYTGTAFLYLSTQHIAFLLQYVSFIVAIPVFFLALFTKEILTLKQHYPRINKVLNYTLLGFVGITLMTYVLEMHRFRSYPPMFVLLLLLGITIYAVKKHNPQAKFIMIGWIVFFTSALFMFLSSKGFYDIFTLFPHYTEFSLIAEAVAFSLLLSYHIKQLQKNELLAKEALIVHQREEKQHLKTLVAKKTVDLETSLEEKKFLLKELNHRVKNNMQTILSFIQLEQERVQNSETKNILHTLKNRIFAINDLYTLLHTSSTIATINIGQYFSLIVAHLQESFDKPMIDVELQTNIEMDSDEAIYCAFILNEALTNIYQHAFTNNEKGKVLISLHQENSQYHFKIRDNGRGYKIPHRADSLGVMIIDTLATQQLKGKIDIVSQDGVELTIVWSKHA